MRDFRHVLESTMMPTTWYHGSSEHIAKFRYPYANDDNNKISSYYGYGIYFIDRPERAEKYGRIVTSVKLTPDADILEGKITKEQCGKVYDQLVAESVKLKPGDMEYFAEPDYGEYSILTDVMEFYDYFTRGYRDSFKTIKDVSDFLLRAGIDGMCVTNDVNDKILIIFNENVITVI